MDHKADFDKTIQNLYSVFGRYNFPAEPLYCTHCISEENDKALRSKPLRELSANDLGRYSWEAVSLWGTVEQFKHLLPRVFETVVTSAYLDCPEVVFKKPRLGGLGTWPEPERHALNAYCEALWRYGLSHHPLPEILPCFPCIGDCLCSIAQIVDELNPLLDYWLSAESTSANLHLVDFACENASHLREVRRLSNGFWEERQEQMQQVVKWFMKQDFAGCFDVATPSTTAPDLRDDLRRAILRRFSAH